MGESCVARGLVEPLLIRLYGLVETGELDFTKSGSTLMKFESDFSYVLERVRESLVGISSKDTLNQFLFSPRLIRGIINYGLEKRKDVLNLKRSLEQVCDFIYMGSNNSARKTLDRLEFPNELLSYKIEEGIDRVSWSAYDPAINEDLIIKLTKNDENPFDYVVIDGHDGYRSGFAIASGIGATPVSIRNSVDSNVDTESRPLIGERDYLEKTLSGKRVLLYGEDISTGRSIKLLKDFIESCCYPENIEVACSIFISGGEQIPIDVGYFGIRRTSLV